MSFYQQPMNYNLFSLEFMYVYVYVYVYVRFGD